MNKRQIRLCRAILDYYDSSGGQPMSLALLARKLGFDASDIYDRDSQSGDLWPFDGKARGSYAGMLAFGAGKTSTVTVTPAGLSALENLLGDEPKAPTKKAPEARPEPVVETVPVPSPARSATAPARMSPLKSKVVTAPPFSPPPAPVVEPAAAAPTAKAQNVSATFTTDDLAAARERFTQWLNSDPAGMALLFQYEGQILVEAAFDKFFREFLRGGNKE